MLSINQWSVLILSLCLFSKVTWDLSTPSDYDNWKQEFGIKHSSSSEDAYRAIIFSRNLAKITSHNKDTSRTYDMGTNQFSGLSTQEFVSIHLAAIPESYYVVNGQTEFQTVQVADINWIEKGAVTAVKNQGNCAAGYAFAAIGSLEGFHKLSYGFLQAYSEQMLIDCSSDHGNDGCRFGLTVNAYEYISEQGVMSEDKYPYTGIKDSCQVKSGELRISGSSSMGNCIYLSNAITKQPIAVSVDATNWQSYKSGIFNNCGTKVNHSVTLVGVSNENWLIKNSWGKSWGAEGFMTIQSGNTCGICVMTCYPNK